MNAPFEIGKRVNVLYEDYNGEKYVVLTSVIKEVSDASDSFPYAVEGAMMIVLEDRFPRSHQYPPNAELAYCVFRYRKEGITVYFDENNQPRCIDLVLLASDVLQ